MSSICHYCGEPGAERFVLNGAEHHFHTGMMKDCLNEFLKEQQEQYFKSRGVTAPMRGEKFSVVSGGRHAKGGGQSKTAQRSGWSS